MKIKILGKWKIDENKYHGWDVVNIKAADVVKDFENVKKYLINLLCRYSSVTEQLTHIQ